MIKFKCLVNGTISRSARDTVISGLAEIYREHFGLHSEDLQVEFTEVVPGMWFTGGKPSSASMVLGSVPADTTQRARVQVMDEIARMFSKATGATYHDVMVVAADPRASD